MLWIVNIIDIRPVVIMSIYKVMLEISGYVWVQNYPNVIGLVKCEVCFNFSFINLQ